MQDYAEIEQDGRRLTLCHYPLRSWNGMGRGAIDLHGHSHGRLAPLPPRERFDAAVLNGVAGTRGVMRGFAGDPNVEPYLDAIYAYLEARASGRLGRGRPEAEP